MRVLKAISERRLRANRANAQRSTGPKTAAGKARSRANAVKHGLSARALRNPELTSTIAALSAAIMKEDQAGLGAALALADAEVTLNEVMKTRAAFAADLEARFATGAMDLPLLMRMLKLTRYERKANSRARNAIRQMRKSKVVLAKRTHCKF